MVITLLRRLFGGHYLRRVREDANHRAWRKHTNALNARIERQSTESRSSLNTTTITRAAGKPSVESAESAREQNSDVS